MYVITKSKQERCLKMMLSGVFYYYSIYISAIRLGINHKQKTHNP